MNITDFSTTLGGKIMKITTDFSTTLSSETKYYAGSCNVDGTLIEFTVISMHDFNNDTTSISVELDTYCPRGTDENELIREIKQQFNPDKE